MGMKDMLKEAVQITFVPLTIKQNPSKSLELAARTGLQAAGGCCREGRPRRQVPAAQAHIRGGLGLAVEGLYARNDLGGHPPGALRLRRLWFGRRCRPWSGRHRRRMGSRVPARRTTEGQESDSARGA